MENSDLLNAFFEQSKDSVVITSADPENGFPVLMANPSFCRMTGYSLQELQGHSLKMLQGPETDQKVIEELRRCLAEGTYFVGSTVNYRKDHSPYIVRWSVSPVRDSHGVITSYVSVQQDITQIKAQEVALEKMAYYDALTKLPNRVLFRERLEKAMALASRSGSVLAICYLDLDGFKPINDTYGHEAGDRLLVEMARRFESVLRGGDTVSRLGGDEFAFLFNLKNTDECEQALSRLLDVVRQPIELNGTQASVSASVGVVLYPTSKVAADELLDHADQAMYLAKKAGKNKFHIFDSGRDCR
jgi:diguanylate cyclase (GGDEF)-like protein/PAS domain S-box-containing protein